MRERVVVSEAFADLKSSHLRLVEEASRLGDVSLHLWPDKLIADSPRPATAFPENERAYWWTSCRYVSSLERAISATHVTVTDDRPTVWVMPAESPMLNERRHWCERHGVRIKLVEPGPLRAFPEPAKCPHEPFTKTRRVVVTGTFDLFHTGHVRFLEEASEYGDLYVCAGHDANIRMLKGPDRPLFPQNERAYVVGSMRFPKLALVTSGSGWLDAAPEIARLRPHLYLVNEDGDVPEKRQYCRDNGIDYSVLKRLPKEGLTARSSTALRSFPELSG